MKKTLLLLVTIIALLSGCKKNKQIIIPANETINNSLPSVNNVEAIQQGDEEIKEFELQEKENPFVNVSSPNADLIDDSIDSSNQLMEQERYANSSKHGLKAIYYDFNDPKIRQDQMDIVNRNLSIAKDLTAKGYEIVIEGHACDSAGSRDYNMHLSESRAQGIADHFVKSGFNKKRVSTVGRGCEMLIVAQGTKEQQAPNRRVEIYAYPARSKK